MDLSRTIAPKSDQMNADDLIAGPRTIKITEVRGHDNADQPVSIHYEGDGGKPYKPCKSMRRVMVNVWGADGSKYPGRSMTLYCDPEVKFGGMKVGGIRISHMSHIENAQKMMLTTTRSKRSEYTVRPLADSQDGEVLIRAREAADQGREKFQEFWTSDYGKANRGLIGEADLAELKQRVADAEDAAKPLSQRISEGENAPDEKSEPEASDAREPDTGSFEFDEGHTASDQGKTVADCPYTDDPIKMQDWLAGFRSKQ